MSARAARWLAVVFAAALAVAATAERAQAAACCGGHAALPSLITGYESARLNSTLSQSTTVGNAPADGRAIFRDPGNRPERTALNFSGSYAFAPRWQAGAALPVGLGSDIGDLQAVVAYELVKQPDIISTDPRVLTFVQLTAPTGRSSYEPGFIDEGQVTGQGFYRAAVGALALSIYRRWDFYALPKASLGLARSFDDGTGGGRERTIDPGWEGDVTVGGGYALNADWRLGASLTSVFAEGFQTREANGESRTLSSSMWWPLEAQVAWFYDLDALVALSYSDETIVGPARNAALSRTISLQYSVRWN